MRIRDWTSDVCSSDLLRDIGLDPGVDFERDDLAARIRHRLRGVVDRRALVADDELRPLGGKAQRARAADARPGAGDDRDLAAQCAHDSTLRSTYCRRARKSTRLDSSH